MLQRFNMPTQTIPMLSKKPKAATADLHKDLLGTRNPGLGYIAKRAQPVLYDADTLLHPAYGIELSREQAYWLPANERASQTSNPNSPVTPVVRKIDHQVSSDQSKFEMLMLYFPSILKCIDTSSASNATFEINKLRKQLQGKDDTIRNLETQIKITENVELGSTEG
ncbi:hypothetical protein Tco_0084667 [Tanacetum coccineum]